MHAASNSCQYSLLTTVIALMQKVEDSGSENSRDVLFVAVAVYLWTDKLYVARLLTKSACFLSYIRTFYVLPEMFACWRSPALA